MKPQNRIVVIAVSNGICGAFLAVASALGIVKVGLAIVIAIAVMGATWILLRRAILDKQSEDARRNGEIRAP